MTSPDRPRLSPHFFRREKDGSVRLRIRFTAEEAALIEEAAGATPLLLYIHRVLGERARYHIARSKTGRELLDRPNTGGTNEYRNGGGPND